MRKEEYNQEAQRAITIIEKKYNIDWSNPKDLTNLTELDLSINQITDISFLKDLTNLTELDLSSNQITDYSFLKNLTSLTYLDLSSNKITDISFLKNLTTLTALGLSSNQITDYSFLKDLTSLTYLDLSSNKITDISFLKDLTNLTKLDLSRNQITDYSFLKDLTSLTYLDLSSNKITDISFLKDLTNLTELDLIFNKITDISFLKDLTNLTKLDLSRNQITDISFLKDLTNLTELDLSNNEITDISFLKDLTNLTTLYLRYNQIKIFPKELLNINLTIKLKDDYEGGIILENNPLKSPPIEIVDIGKEAMVEYFDACEEGKEELNELKVIFIGDGGAGKTSLIKQIFDDGFDKNESMTHGINIRDRRIDIDGKRIKTHFWDFGGQEMMHSTHQFFLSNRSLYVLVLDGRKEEDSEYWLNFIKTFGGNSPVMVVLNKMDDHQSYEVNRKFLSDKYPNIIGFYKTSCLSGNGIEAFYADMKASLLKAEFVDIILPTKWLEIKDRVERLEDDFINSERFNTICEEFGIVEPKIQNVISDYLDSLGIAIHFDDFELNHIHTLKPQWVTNGVYKIVTSKELDDNKGVFDLHLLRKLLDTKVYPIETHRYLIELMKKFELCYSLDACQVLIPTSLEIEEKTFEFNYEDALKFELEYSFLPPSVISTFIVKSHEDIKDKLRWRSGVVLEDKSTKTEAVVRVDNREKRVSIYVNGEQKRDLFAVIRKRFDEINSKFKEIAIDELIPLSNSTKVKVKYKELIGYEKAGRNEYFSGELGEAFSVSKLLNGIERPENRESAKYQIFNGEVIMGNSTKIGDGNSHVNVNQTDKSVKVGGNSSGIINTGNHNTIMQTITTTNNDLKELLENLQVEANKVMEALSIEKQKEFKDDVELFINNAQENKINKHFNLSKEGLLEASKAVGKVGVKLAGYIPKILDALGV
jgi:small GTP-binding protein